MAPITFWAVLSWPNGYSAKVEALRPSSEKAIESINLYAFENPGSRFGVIEIDVAYADVT